MNKLITKSLAELNADFIMQIPLELQTKQEMKWFKWIKDYIATFGQPPTLDRFCIEFSDFVSIETNDPLKDVFFLDVGFRRNSLVREWIIANSESLREGKDPYRELSLFLEKLNVATIESIGAGDVDLSLFTDKVVMFNTGFDSIDSESGGLSKGDLMYIFGRPGSGKTTLLFSMIVSWVLTGKRVVVISNEIRYEDVLYKLYAQIAGIDQSAKRKGSLTDVDKKKLLAVRHFLAQNNNLHVVKKPIHDVNHITSYIENDTDIVAIDGAYLMAKSPDWKDLTQVSNTLRAISNNTGVAIVGVIQANRSAAEKTSLESVAGSDSFTQDADILLGVNNAGAIVGGRSVNIMSSKNRHGVPIQFAVNFKLPVIYSWEDS